MNLWYIAKKKDRKFRGITYKEFEKTLLDENLRGTISIGFDDDSDSNYANDEKPDVILKYLYDTDKTQFETDVSVLKCDNWRYAVAEFFQYFVEFDYALSVNKNMLSNIRVQAPLLPIKKNYSEIIADLIQTPKFLRYPCSCSHATCAFLYL